MQEQDKSSPPQPVDPEQAFELLKTIEERIAQLKSQQSGQVVDAQDIQKLLQKLEKQKKKIREQYERLEAWRVRLLQRRRIMKFEREHLEGLEAQYAQLVRQRTEVLEAKRVLSSTETSMRQRWATHHAAVVVSAVVLALFVVAFFSYQVGQQSTAPIWRATALLDTAPPGEGVSSERWLGEHRTRLLSQDTLERTIYFLSQHSHRPFTSANKLRENLDESLEITSPKDGQIELAYVDTDTDRGRAMLESVSRAYRAGWPEEDRANEPTVIRAPATDPEPLVDRRLAIAARTFGMAVAVMLTLLVVCRRWLLRSAPVFSVEHDAAFEAVADDSRWPGKLGGSAPPVDTAQA